MQGPCFCSDPCFPSRLLKKKVTVFLSFCIFCPDFAPNWTCTWLFLVPYNLYFVAGGEVCPSIAILQQGGPGPSPSYKEPHKFANSPPTLPQNPHQKPRDGTCSLKSQGSPCIESGGSLHGPRVLIPSLNQITWRWGKS